MYVTAWQNEGLKFATRRRGGISISLKLPYWHWGLLTPVFSGGLKGVAMA